MSYRLDLLDELRRHNRVRFIGYQRQAFGSFDSQGGRCLSEGYPGATVNQIRSRLFASGALAQRPNLVLLMAGAADLIAGRNPFNLARRLERLVEEIFEELPDAVILLAHATHIGTAYGFVELPIAGDTRGALTPMQISVNQYNAAINSLTNKLRTWVGRS